MLMGRSSRPASSRLTLVSAAPRCRPPTFTPPIRTPFAITSRREWSYRYMAPASRSSNTAHTIATVTRRGRVIAGLLRHGSEEASIESAALRGRADQPIVAPGVGARLSCRAPLQEDDPGMPYRDRRDAGRQLAAELKALAPVEPVIVALPRGGVPVAVEVARAL